METKSDENYCEFLDTSIDNSFSFSSRVNRKPIIISDSEVSESDNDSDSDNVNRYSKHNIESDVEVRKSFVTDSVSENSTKLESPKVLLEKDSNNLSNSQYSSEHESNAKGVIASTQYADKIFEITDSNSKLTQFHSINGKAHKYMENEVLSVKSASKNKLDHKYIDSKTSETPLTSSNNSRPNDECIVLSSDTDDGGNGEYSIQTSALPDQFNSGSEKIMGEIEVAKSEVFKIRNNLMSANLETLPDHGIRLQFQLREKEKHLKYLREELKRAQDREGVAFSNLKKETVESKPKKLQKAGFVDAFEPSGMGAKAMETYRTQKALTVDALQQLHSSLETCPDENTFAEDPQGLCNGVKLMPHQKRALAWLLWREHQNPHGGILADDMGLGKTLTMISLVLAKKENKDNFRYSSSDDGDSDSEDKENWYSYKKNQKGGTLVICPASLLNQWGNEIENKCRKGALSKEVYHGSSRIDSYKHLIKRDVVITTYNIVRSEVSRNGLLPKIKWERLILDEAHVIRNHKSQCSVAVCQLKSHFRWILTGTPIQNKEQDMFALLKFLRCSPFDDLTMWKKWVDNKSSSGQQRLTTLLNTLMLRRTKEQLQEAGTIQSLPDRTMEVIDVTLDKDEFAVYEQVLILSKTLFGQFLQQKVSKEQSKDLGFEFLGNLKKPISDHPFKLNSELAALHDKLRSMPVVKSFEILMLLLRLRQLCCHPFLAASMLDEESCEVDGIEINKETDYDVVSHLSSLVLEDNETEEASQRKKIFSRSNPVFQESRMSSKMKKLFEILEKNVLSAGDKAVIVSQWASMLKILSSHMRNFGISSSVLSGAVPVKDRMTIVDAFNNPNADPQILLLSLTAGGVGLNLVGGNHLFLFDLHWNPQLEAQACDRIYRVGQTKPVYIYKFVCEETIEQRIDALQKSKLSLADAVLTGSKRSEVNKLSLDDLRMLFNV